MNNNIITIENKKYKRIDKRQAKRIYNDGGAVLLCPVRLNPSCIWNIRGEIRKNDGGGDFEKMLMYFNYYNCNNSDTGYYPAYYTELKEG